MFYAILSAQKNFHPKFFWVKQGATQCYQAFLVFSLFILNVLGWGVKRACSAPDTVWFLVKSKKNWSFCTRGYPSDCCLLNFRPDERTQCDRSLSWQELIPKVNKENTEENLPGEAKAHIPVRKTPLCHGKQIDFCKHKTLSSFELFTLISLAVDFSNPLLSVCRPNAASELCALERRHSAQQHLKPQAGSPSAFVFQNLMTY